MGTQNKQKWIVHLKNITLNKLMNYFHAEKFCFLISHASHILSERRPTFLTAYPDGPHGL